MADHAAFDMHKDMAGEYNELCDELKGDQAPDPRKKDQKRLLGNTINQNRDYWRTVGQAVGTRRYFVGGDAVPEFVIEEGD